MLRHLHTKNTSYRHARHTLAIDMLKDHSSRSMMELKYSVSRFLAVTLLESLLSIVT